MKTKIDLLQLFSKFIKESSSGRRVKSDGTRIKDSTIRNYEMASKHLNQFSVSKNFPIRMHSFNKLSKREQISESIYWKKFYFQFTQYLYSQKLFDNYVGLIIKTIRTFFNYLEKDKLISTGKFHLKFYVCKHENPILTLNHERLQFLIFNKEFHDKLPEHLKQAKNIFIFGCTVSLRFGDLISVQWKDIECLDGKFYLNNKSKKTKTYTKVLIPNYLIPLIIEKQHQRRNFKCVFEKISLNQFNNNLKKLAEIAGWTELVKFSKSRQGKLTEYGNVEKGNRFCDKLSSHFMRRTAITMMLISGLPEHLVRKVSGHSKNSASFFRYVEYSQPYLDENMQKLYGKIGATQTVNLEIERIK